MPLLQSSNTKTKIQMAFSEFLSSIIFIYLFNSLSQTNRMPELAYPLPFLVFCSISGSHMNPSVTLSLMILKDQDVGNGFIHIFSQIFGGTIGIQLILGLLMCQLTQGKFIGIPQEFNHTINQVCFSEILGNVMYVTLLMWNIHPKTTISNQKIQICMLNTISFIVFREMSYISGGLFNLNIPLSNFFTCLMIFGNSCQLKYNWIYILAGLLAGVISPIIYILCSQFLIPRGKNIYIEDTKQENGYKARNSTQHINN